VPATVLVSAARAPLGAKLGFCFSTGGAEDLVTVDAARGPAVKAAFCEGSGAFERLNGLVGLGEGDRLKMRRDEGDCEGDERSSFEWWDLSSRGLLRSSGEEERRLRWPYVSIGLREREYLLKIFCSFLRPFGGTSFRRSRSLLLFFSRSAPSSRFENECDRRRLSLR